MSSKLPTLLCRTALTTALALAVLPLGAQPLDLERVVALALAQNPALQVQNARRTEVEGAVREARADAFPQLDLVSNWSRSRNPQLLNSPDFADIIDFLPEGFEPSEQELWGWGVQVSQTLWSGGKVGAAIDLARLAVEATEAQISTARLTTAAQAAQGYYGLLAAIRGLEAIRSQERARRESLAVVEARYELGDATRLEQLRARTALEQLGPTLAVLEGEVEVQRSELRVVLGLAPGTAIELAETTATLAEPPALETLLGGALAARPELHDLEHQIAARARQRIVIGANGRPQVELNGYYGRQARLPENLDDSLYADWSFALGMTWSFFDGGRRKGEIAQVDSVIEQLRWQRRDVEHRVALELEQALTGYRTARTRHAAAKTAAETAREATHVARESYQLGAALQADLLDAQEQETQAELDVVAAYFDALARWSELLRAAGKLPTEPLF